MLVSKHHCGADVDVDTNGFGRTIDVCRRCGVLRPGWQSEPPPVVAAPSPSAPPPSPPASTMAPITKKCQRSGVAFTARGPAQKWCGECPACKKANAESPAPAKKPKRHTPEPPEKKRARIETGLRREPRSTRSASGIDLSGAIAKIEEQVAALDAQRERLLGAIESLRELEA